MNNSYNIPTEHTGSVPNTIDCYTRYGIPRKLIHHMLINHFHYPAAYQDTLSHYELKYWSAAYTRGIISNGCISEFLVVYHNCTPTDINKWNQASLSFRKANILLDIPAYVLIRCGDSKKKEGS